MTAEKGTGLKVAVTLFAASMVTAQVPVPVQALLQPAKVLPAAGVAVRVTLVPLGKFPLQVVPQLMPAGLLVIAPVPEPELVTVSVLVPLGSTMQLTVGVLVAFGSVGIVATTRILPVAIISAALVP